MKSGNSRPAAWLNRSHLVLAGLLVFTMVVRAGVLWAMRDNLSQDPDAYREIAENLLRHGEFALGKPGGVSKPTPTAYRPPLYPVVLSNLPAADGHEISPAKVAMLHLALGVASVWLACLTTERYLANGAGPSGLSKELGNGSDTPTFRSGLLPFGPPGLWIAPLVAGLLVACDPILLNQQTLVMTETLAAFLAILSLWCLARFDQSRTWFNAALGGGAIGLAILCRPTFLPWLGLVGVTVLFVRGPDFRFQISDFRFGAVGWRLVNAAALILTAAGVVSPWAIRNYQVFGKPILTTTHGGYTLYLGNNESFYDYLAKGDFDLPWDASSLGKRLITKDLELTEEMVKELALLNAAFKEFENKKRQHRYTDHPELPKDYIAYAFAKSRMREHPREATAACLYRVWQLWSPLPHKLTKDESTGRMLMRYGTCAWYCGVYALAAVGVWNLSRGWGVVGAAHPTGTPQRAFPTGPWIWGVLLCLAFTAVHTFYWTNLRMRAPLMPFVAMVAAAAVMSKVPSPRSKVQG